MEQIQKEKLSNSALLLSVLIFLVLTIATAIYNFICFKLKININDYILFFKSALILKIFASVIIGTVYTLFFNRRMTKLFKIKSCVYVVFFIGLFLLIKFIHINEWLNFGIIYSIHISTGILIYTTLGITNQILLKQQAGNKIGEKAEITRNWNTYVK